MARFNSAFDASGVEPAKPYELLPAGMYVAQIVESEMRVTKDGNGQFLWLMLDILEGPHRGRKLFDQLNLINSNPVTVDIGQRTLSAICHATGQIQVADSEELHLRPMTISISIKPPKNGYGERNAIQYVVPDAIKSGKSAMVRSAPPSVVSPAHGRSEPSAQPARSAPKVTAPRNPQQAQTPHTSAPRGPGSPWNA